MVEHSHRNLLDIEGDRISKEDHEERGHQDHQSEAYRIAKDMEEFFLDDGTGSGEIQRSSSLSMSETNTSSKEGLIRPILFK